MRPRKAGEHLMEGPTDFLCRTVLQCMHGSNAAHVMPSRNTDLAGPRILIPLPVPLALPLPVLLRLPLGLLPGRLPVRIVSSMGVAVGCPAAGLCLLNRDGCTCSAPKPHVTIARLRG